MLTPTGWIVAGLGVALLGAAGAVGVTQAKLKDARAEIVELKDDKRELGLKVEGLEAQVKRVALTSVGQSEAAAVVCQGTGAQLFERGRALGRAERQVIQCATQ